MKESCTVYSLIFMLEVKKERTTHIAINSALHIHCDIEREKIVSQFDPNSSPLLTSYVPGSQYTLTVMKFYLSYVCLNCVNSL